jgi:hypothetical protein
MRSGKEEKEKKKKDKRGRAPTKTGARSAEREGKEVEEKEEGRTQDRRVKEADLERYRRDLSALREKLNQALTRAGFEEQQSAAHNDDREREDTIWLVYAGVEKLVAILRFRLEYETPATFANLPVEEEEGPATLGLVHHAADLLSTAQEELDAGRLVAAVQTLRGARNDMRSHLISQKKAASRRAPLP